MRFFLISLILILSFQSWSKADDIKDFEIEGMSIGDSLLEYFNRNEIISNIEKDYYKHNKFQTAEFYQSEKFKKYDSISFSFKKKDTNYKIVNIVGINFYENIKVCHEDMSSIDDEISYIFKKLERTTDNSPHEVDEKGESFVKAIRYWFDNDDIISIACYDWSKRLTDAKGWTDNLSIEITTREFNEWLVNKAFN
tara:strand:+ start:13 stop:600 length:588 start_codon:yes stop_codon:yes gene_type:complete